MRSACCSLLLCLLFLSVSCAPKLLNVRGNSNSVVAKFDKSPKKKFYLRNANGRIISSSQTVDNEIYFNLPDNFRSDNYRLSITDKDRNKLAVKEGQEYFRNLSWESLISIKELKASEFNKLTETKKVIASLKSVQTKNQRELKANGSFLSGECKLKKAGYIPPMPKTACSRYNAQEKATAACLATSGLPEACSLAASAFGKELDINVRNFISSPACGKLVADFLGNSYELEDFLGDVALGLGQDIATDLMKQKDLGSQLLGVLLGAYVLSEKVNRFNRCVSSARYKCRQEYTRWEARKTQILEKPQKEYDACRSSFITAQYTGELVKKFNQHLAGIQSRDNELRAKVDEFRNLKSSNLRDSRKPFGRSKMAVTASDIRFRTMLGLTGQDAKSFTHQGKTYNYGIKISAISSPDLPAAKAGLRAGDIIYKMDETLIDDMSSFVKYVQSKGTREMEMFYIQRGTVKSMKISAANARAAIGFNTIDAPVGIEVTRVLTSYLGRNTKIKTGDVLLAMDGTPILDGNHFLNLLSRADDRSVLITYKTKTGQIGFARTELAYVYVLDKEVK